MFTPGEIGRKRAWVVAAVRLGCVGWAAYAVMRVLPVMVEGFLASGLGGVGYVGMAVLAGVLPHAVGIGGLLIMQHRIAKWVWPMPSVLKNECPNCGYPKPAKGRVCPECGTSW